MKRLLLLWLLICLETALLAAEDKVEPKATDESEELPKVVLLSNGGGPPKTPSEIEQEKKEKKEREERLEKYRDFDRRISNILRKIKYESLLPEGETKIPNRNYTLPKAEVVHKRKASMEHQKLCKKLLKIFKEMEEFYKDRDCRQEILSKKAMSIYYYMNPNYKSDREVMEYTAPYLEWRIWEMPLRITNWGSAILYIENLSDKAHEYPRYYKKFLKNRKKYLARYLEILELGRSKLVYLPEAEERLRNFKGDLKNVMEDRMTKNRLSACYGILKNLERRVQERSLWFGMVVVLLYEQTAFSKKDMKEIQDLMDQYHFPDEYQENVYMRIDKAKAQKQAAK